MSLKEPGLKAKEIETRGRKTKLNAEIIASLYTQVRLGIPILRALAIVGISSSAYYKWLENARDAIEKAGNDLDLLDDNSYVELMDTVARAEGELMAEGIGKIKEEGPAGWRWLLARLFRKEFGDQVDLGIPLGNVKLQLELPGIAEVGSGSDSLDAAVAQIGEGSGDAEAIDTK